MIVRRAIAFLILVPPALLAGCNASKPLPPTFAVGPGRYDAAFDAAREVLRDTRFLIDRVDARAGIISTAPKRSSGLATPWDDEQSSARDEFEDLVNHQQRTVRITFEPAEPQAPGSNADAQLGETAIVSDLRRYPGPVTARVQVVVEREHRPGWRVQSVAIGSSTFTQDPSLGPRGMAGSYWVPVAQDPALAGRLAARIESRFSPSPPAPGPTPSSPGK